MGCCQNYPSFLLTSTLVNTLAKLPSCVIFAVAETSSDCQSQQKLNLLPLKNFPQTHQAHNKLCNSQGDGMESPWWRLMKATFSWGLFPRGKRLQQQSLWRTFICARQPLSTKHSDCNPHWLRLMSSFFYLYMYFLAASLHSTLTVFSTVCSLSPTPLHSPLFIGTKRLERQDVVIKTRLRPPAHAIWTVTHARR